MIPKKIHYCWFGRGKKPELALRCIDSWKRFLPDYELIEWTEDKFDIKKAPRYVREAYKARQFAFVTDYVRLFAIYNHGGIYMDTDVEVLKPLERFLSHNAFTGFEDNKNVQTGIMASEKGGKWAKDQLDLYHDPDLSFYNADGSVNQTPNVKIITDYMLAHGLVPDNTFQDFDGLITVYPSDWFCPKSWANGVIKLTDNTHAIHHFEGSWKKTTPRYKFKYRARLWCSHLIDLLGMRGVWNVFCGKRGKR